MSDNEPGGGQYAAWIETFIRLGARVARYARHHPDRQLIVALSVPRRDFAAVLVGCGWTVMSSPPPLDPPLEVLSELKRGTPVRVVTKDNVRLTRFEGSMGTFVKFGDSRYEPGEQIIAVSVAPSAGKTVTLPRVPPGTIGALSPRRLARPTADLALVGKVKWLREDMKAYLSCEGIPTAKPTRLADLLLPEIPDAATWSTRLYSYVGFDKGPPLPADIRAVILDGAGAIKFLSEIKAPVVFCIIDRSVADESAAELIMQQRNNWGKAVSIREDIGQPIPSAVEALAFTVAL